MLRSWSVFFRYSHARSRTPRSPSPAGVLLDAVKAGGLANQVGDDIGLATIKYTAGVDPIAAIIDGIDEIAQGDPSEPSAGQNAGRLVVVDPQVAQFQVLIART